MLHVLRSLDWGGVEEMALRIAEWSNHQGVAAAISAGPGPLRERVPEAVPIFERGDGDFLQLVLQVGQAARKWGATVLHAHQRREALACLVVGRILGIAVVEHAHTQIPDRRGRYLSFRSSLIFAVSQPVADMVVSEFGRPGDRVMRVDNVPAVVSVGEAPGGVLPSRDAPLNLVGIGRVTEQKDPARFVDVMSELDRLRPVKAVWVGAGHLLEEMRSLAEGTPVTFVGPRYEVETQLRAADALVMTSRWEGLPLVVLEALACGTPVVATPAGGTRELLEGERCGVIVDEDATDGAFAQVIFDALAPNGGAAERIENGLRLIRERYTPDLAFEPILRGYRAVA